MSEITKNSNVNGSSKDVTSLIKKEGNIRERHELVSAWLWIMLVINVIMAIVYFLGKGHYLKDNFSFNYYYLIFALIYVVNIVFVFLLLRWKKIGFWGIAVSTVIISIIATICDFIPDGHFFASEFKSSTIGIGIVLTLFVLLKVVKKNGVSCWEYME